MGRGAHGVGGDGLPRAVAVIAALVEVETGDVLSAVSGWVEDVLQGRAYVSAGPERVVDQPQGHAEGIAQFLAALDGHGAGFTEGVRETEVGELLGAVDVRGEVLDDKRMVQIVVCVFSIVSRAKWKTYSASGLPPWAK